MFRLGRSTSITALAWSLTAALGLSACAPGGDAAPSGAAPTGRVETDPARMGNLTLRVLDTFSGGVDDAWMDDVVEEFGRKYPNIKVKRTSQGWGDAMREMPLKLKSSDPPDIVPPNNGWQSLGALVKGGLVLNLDRYAEAHGWDKRLPPSIRRQHAFSADGTRMGTGSLFGMPVARASMIEVHYNRSLLRRFGEGGTPTTLAAFESDMAAAKKAGVTPLCFGNADQAGITTPLFSLMNSYSSQEDISRLVYSQRRIPVRDTGFPKAVATFKKWASKGWLTDDYAGIAAGDAAQEFIDGKCLYHFNYSGSLPLSPGEGKNLGSFVLPRAGGGIPLATSGSTSNLSVAAKTRHPDAAAAFLDFAASRKAAELAVRHSAMPLLEPGLKGPKDNPLFADDVANAAQVTQHDASVPYLDWATPTLLGTLQRRTQDLLAGRTTVDAVVRAVQQDDDAFTAKQKKSNP